MSRPTLRLFLALALTLTLSPIGARVSAERNQISRQSWRAATRIPPAPEDVLGFRPGDDRKLAAWASVIEYFKRLDAASDRVKFEELGRTTMGAPFVMATISAPENLARLDEFREIQAGLADPRTLGANMDGKARQLIARGKTIVLITCGIHSDEVGSYLSSMLIAHRLASSDDAEILNILRNCIILLVPSLNPDGVDIVKNWYDQTLNTPFEGTDPPVLYHKYTGHDDNRDWYAFTQAETQLAIEKIHNVWHPQIVHDIHQMEENGARLFLPPYMQPVEPNVPPQIVEGYTELGRSIAADMRAQGFKGITQDSIYDAWSPSRAYSHYHGGVRILSETASCKIATPITVKFEDLRPGLNYDPRKVSPTFPDLWPGGEWHLRDITNYMTTAAFSLLRHAAENRERWLTRFYEIGKEAVRPRKRGELWGYEIQPSSKNYLLLNYALNKGGVELDWCETGKHSVSQFVKLAQPYGGFAKALLEKQRYPNLRDSAGNPISPYDVTAHTLSLMTDVLTKPVYAPFRCRQADWCDDNRLPVYSLNEKLAIYKSHVPSIDEGWTRWAIQNNGSYFPNEPVKQTDEKRPPFTSLEDAEARSGNLGAKYDTIIIPDQSPRVILEGYRKGTMPEELTGGLGAEGAKALREFVEGGGTLILLNRASDFAIEQFGLPLRDITAGLKRTEFYVPGSILRVELDTSHPITRGMPKESIAWAEGSPVFEVTDQKEARARVRVIARYPATGDPLLSGWLLGGERIKGKAALVEVALGRGHIYLFGFRPQYRGQSLATYPLLFNAISQRRED
ncbi:MAG TPA: M14 family zinc carboxypeptidase [Pyrinomonadaceae bacterium]|nr:M14 family zinc carboxypeptidase [Pyrinomonadaceae bacterium]